MNLEQNIKHLESFLEFEEDWNLYGAKPYKKSLIDKCIYLLNKITKQPESIQPTGRQSILFCYSKEDKSILIFEIHENTVICCIIPQKDFSKGKEFEIRSLKEIKEIINEFFKDN